MNKTQLKVKFKVGKINEAGIKNISKTTEIHKNS